VTSIACYFPFFLSRLPSTRGSGRRSHGHLPLFFPAIRGKSSADSCDSAPFLFFPSFPPALNWGAPPRQVSSSLFHFFSAPVSPTRRKESAFIFSFLFFFSHPLLGRRRRKPEICFPLDVSEVRRARGTLFPSPTEALVRDRRLVVDGASVTFPPPLPLSSGKAEKVYLIGEKLSPLPPPPPPSLHRSCRDLRDKFLANTSPSPRSPLPFSVRQAHR